MNVSTITMERGEARKAMADYRRAVKSRHVKESEDVRKRIAKEDEMILKGYRVLADGKQLLDLNDSMKLAGCDERGRPNLAIARADARLVHCEKEWGGHYRDTICFWSGSSKRGRNEGRRVYVPTASIPGYRTQHQSRLRAVVPLIPAPLRPDGPLHKYHVLWDADWEEIPIDPMLLKHLSGTLYAVLATWDLTELERMVLRIERES